MAFSVITPKKLGRGAISATPTLTTFYTVPSLTRTIVKTMDICNTTSTAIRVTVYFVQSGGSALAENTIIPDATIAGNGMLQWSGAQVLNEGDSISAVASAAGCTMNISGGECV